MLVAAQFISNIVLICLLTTYLVSNYRLNRRMNVLEVKCAILGDRHLS